MFGWGLNLVTTVIGFGMSAAFIIFVCARLICARLRSPDPHLAPPHDLDLDIDLDLPSQPIEHNFNGLQPVTIAAIPTIKYNHTTFVSTENAQCSICLGDYEEKETLRIIPACHHSFHLVCIDLWLQKQSTCPICRLPLKDIIEGKCTSESSPTALVPWTNTSITGPPTRDQSANQQITNARGNNGQVSSEFVQVVITSS